MYVHLPRAQDLRIAPRCPCLVGMLVGAGSGEGHGWPGDGTGMAGSGNGTGMGRDGDGTAVGRAGERATRI